MNTATTTKIGILSFAFVLIASACSRTARLGRSIALDPNKAQFLIWQLCAGLSEEKMKNHHG